MRVHAARLLGGAGSLDHDFKAGALLATGGAAVNTEILQIMADVFGVPVMVVGMQTDAAPFGAALRAIHGHVCQKEDHFVRFEALCGRRVKATRRVAATPNLVNHAMYTAMLPKYSENEALVATR